MIYSKLKTKDYKRPKRKRNTYKKGDLVFIENFFHDHDRIKLILVEIMDSHFGRYQVRSKYSIDFYILKDEIFGKISPNNKLYRLINV